MKIVIVGGVAGGASAAARLRRLDEDAEIILLEKGKHISYANCGLPYYIGGTISEKDDILIQTPEAFKNRFNVAVRIMNEAVLIDREKKEVVIKNHTANSTYKESYDKIVLSPGAEPIRPPIKGMESKKIFTLRSVDDSEAIKEFIENSSPKRAIVVGAGYIGLEMAENLHQRGIAVTIVEMAPQVVAPLDMDMAAIVYHQLKFKNVGIYLSEQVTQFQEKMNGITALLKSGKELSADFVIMSAGVKPDISLALKSNIKIGEAGGIFVNEYLQTSDENIYAVGDAIEFTDPFLKKPKLVPLAGPANKQGRIAANNIILGNKEKYKGTIGTAIAKVFDLSVGLTGFSEKVLKQKNIEYYATITHGSSNAGYYPGAMPLTIKLVYSKDKGTVLGAQVIGYKGVDKACEVLSLVCQHNMTVYDLKDMEQAYAPPYSSAKSPVNMAGFAAENVLSGLVKTASWQDVMNDNNAKLLLDVRNKEEVMLGSVPGSMFIPLNEIRSRINEISKDKKVYVYCASGLRSYIAARILRQKGFKDVYNVTGGYKTFEMINIKPDNEEPENIDMYGKSPINKDDAFYSNENLSEKQIIELNTCGLQCPGPIMKLSDKIKTAAHGAQIKVFASDPGFLNDIKSWCSVTGNRLLDSKMQDGKIIVLLEKGHGQMNIPGVATNNNKTIVVFSDDFDKAIAAFVITNGALSMGRKVTLFFTFWGLNILKKENKASSKKDFISKMFSLMLPKGPGSLALSKLNMFGFGPKLMKFIMKNKNIDSLENLIANALKSGVEIIACQMSMDVMGIQKEELIDGIKIGGVATYIEASESAGTNLFI